MNLTMRDCRILPNEFLDRLRGWGNNEKQFYTDRDTMNAIVKDPILSIIEKQEHRGENEYTSARFIQKEKQNGLMDT